MLPPSVKKYFYRAILKIWAILHLPKYLFVADTNILLPAWYWQVAIPARIDTTQISYTGMKRNRGKYFYEPIEAPHFKDLLKGRKIFFDVGANIGYYSYLAAASGVEKIVAFEFMEEYASFTRKVFEIKSIQGDVINRGVGNPAEQTRYFDPTASVAGKTISLDEFSKENNIYPDIMKMNIEGYELDTLRNVHEILLRKPTIDISIHPRFLEDRGQNVQQLLDLLAGYGYKIIWVVCDTYFMRAD